MAKNDPLKQGLNLMVATGFYKNNGFGRTKMQILGGCHAFITGGASGMGLGMAVTIADVERTDVATVGAGRALFATHPEFLAGIEVRMARIKESFLRQPRM